MDFILFVFFNEENWYYSRIMDNIGNDIFLRLWISFQYLS